MIDLSLTNEELNALKEYLDEDYKAINQMLITDAETDVALLSGDAGTKGIHIDYSRSYIIEYLKNIKLIYKLILKQYYKKAYKRDIKVYRGTNLLEVETFKNDLFVDRFLTATTKKSDAEKKYSAEWNRPACMNISLDNTVPFIYISDVLEDKDGEVLISPFTKIKDIVEDKDKKINKNSKTIKIYNVELEKQELDELADRERNGLYDFVLDNAYSIERKIEECIELEEVNIVNFENIRKLEQLLNKYENNDEQREQDSESINEVEDDVLRISRELDELKEKSTDLYEQRKQNIEFINNWKKNITVYMMAECKEIEKRFEDMELPRFKHEVDPDNKALLEQDLKEAEKVIQMGEVNLIDNSNKKILDTVDLNIDKTEEIDNDVEETELEEEDLVDEEVVSVNADTDEKEIDIDSGNIEENLDKDEIENVEKLDDKVEDTDSEELEKQETKKFDFTEETFNKEANLKEELEVDLKTEGFNKDEVNENNLEKGRLLTEELMKNELVKEELEKLRRNKDEIESEIKEFDKNENSEISIDDNITETSKIENDINKEEKIENATETNVESNIEIEEDDEDKESISYITKNGCKENIEVVNRLIEDINLLITKQQNHAKVAGNMGASYSALNNAFEMRKSAEKLLELLETTKEKVKMLTEKRTNARIEERLEKISKNNIEISTLINYLNNPKIAAKNSQITRFDEMAIIEENELKRCIAEKIREIRGEAELKKLKDDLEIIEDKGNVSRFFGIFTGQNKLDDFMIEQIEVRRTAIRKTLAKKMSLVHNYSIHELVAEIEMFVAENEDDELVENDVLDLKAMEEELKKNYVILESKVDSIIEEKEGRNLPIKDKRISRREIIEIETYRFLNKYGYDGNYFYDEEEPTYQDTMTGEINRIIEYVNSSDI